MCIRDRLKFEEFNELVNQIVYVSATPAAYEREESGGISAEQIIRPTGLLDPIIELHSTCLLYTSSSTDRMWMMFI